MRLAEPRSAAGLRRRRHTDGAGSEEAARSIGVLRLRGPLVFLAVGTAYLGLAEYARWLNGPAHLDLGRGFWPAVGLATAALLVLPGRRWVWAVAAVAAAELGGDIAHGYPVAASLWWVAANTVGPLVAASLLRRFVHPRGALVPMRNLVGFLALGVVAGPLVGGSLGAVGSMALSGDLWWQVWPRAVTGSALGVLVVAPALLTWREGHPRRRSAETVALVVALVAVTVVSPLLSRNPEGVWDVTVPFLVVPLVVWAALRYGVRGAAWVSLWSTQRAALATAMGYGPFAIVGAQSGHAVTLLLLFLVIAPVSALLMAVLVTDLGGRDKVESRLQRQAHHDALTGLPNRAALSSYLEQALERRHGHSTDVVLLVCDLDGFKVINDGLGHQAGDEVLVEVARRLQASVRPSDLVARLSGDEFVVLAEDTTAQAIASLTERLLAVVAAPVTLTAGQQVAVGVSIGVVTAAPHHDAHSLLRDGDAALYRAKNRGRGRAEHFDDDLREQAIERLALPQELRAGLARAELFCVYQPEIEIASGRLVGFESFVRWQHPDRGLLLPDRFIPLAEVAGLVGAVFAHVLDESLQAQQRWATTLGFRPAVSVNLSTRQLHDTTLPDLVAKALTRTGVPAPLLWLEVTEGAIVDAASFEALAALHDLGVHLAIDDFGTGWSSMARLSESPWDLLKIDRSFIAKLTTDPRAEHVVHAIIAMAHALGIRTVAEGVETPEQLEVLSSLSCDIAQGYLFAQPREARHATDGVAADRTWTPAPAVPRSTA